MSDNSQSELKTLLLEALSAVNSTRWNIAENICKKILALYPDHLDATYMLALIYQNNGNSELAVTYYEKILFLSTCHADALNNLGTIYESSGNSGEALSCYKKAVKCNPSHFMANYNLGRISRSIGDLVTAITSLRTALDADKKSVPVLLELGLALKNRGEAAESLPYLLKAAEITPENPAVFNVLGNSYQLKGELKQAISCYQTAIQHKPDFAEAYNNLGSAYLAMGDVAAALESYQKAIELRPGWNGAFSNMLLAENYVSNNQDVLFHKHAAWGMSLKDSSQHGQQNITNCNNTKIRIGYVSPDLRTHSVSWFLMAILRNYNRHKFHVTCFSDTAQQDHITNEIMRLVDDWQNVTGQSDNDVFKRIRECNIDILVDLAGHTANNRLGVFAKQATPIQVSYLGYPNTTGLNTVKYRITDSLADPAGDADRLHTERLIRLPECFVCYTPSPESPACSAAPFKINNYITFGSFNVLAKISDECLETWSKILLQVRHSKLVLKSAGLEDPETRYFMHQRFKQYNIHNDQIEMLPRTSTIRSHIQQYSRIDISLDTFPYNGTTTTCESLWMGVPIISLRGNRHAGRVGASLLSQVGLDELITDDTEQYIATAKRLAESNELLTTYHNTLRQNIASSPLCDGPEFTRALEQAFTEMLQ